ncbi:TPA: hypothetical protein ACS727_001272 [Providencia alcalifaciens]
MENQLTTDQKIAIANMAKDLVTSALDNKLSNQHMYDSTDPKWRGHRVDTLFDYFYEHISNKIKES